MRLDVLAISSIEEHIERESLIAEAEIDRAYYRRISDTANRVKVTR
jgi:hypothetical protein